MKQPPDITMENSSIITFDPIPDGLSSFMGLFNEAEKRIYQDLPPRYFSVEVGEVFKQKGNVVWVRFV